MHHFWSHDVTFMLSPAICFFQNEVMMMKVEIRSGDHLFISTATVLPAKSDSGVMFCLQSYQGFIIDRSLVY